MLSYRMQEEQKIQHDLIFSQVMDFCNCWRRESAELKKQLDVEKIRVREHCSTILHQCALASESWLHHQKKLESSLVEMQNKCIQAETRLDVEKKNNTEMVESYETQLSAAAAREKCTCVCL